MKAIIKVDVPEFQIGQEVTIYYRDTMCIKGVCEKEEERKTGKWIRDGSWSEGCGMGETYGYYYKCSECGAKFKNDYKKCSYNFCPHCGAIMKGE